jgi:diacylglycerol kinase family enzyme
VPGWATDVWKRRPSLGRSPDRALAASVAIMGARNAEQLPAFLNRRAGTAETAAECLRGDSRFVVREFSPANLAGTMRREVAHGARRVLVCGGDGTIATAAAVAADLDVELAILPGGTLNHFARRLGIPTELNAALDVAAVEEARPIDVAYLGDNLFLNTSSVGAYVSYVHMRERFERWLGYRFASALAALRLLFGLRSLHVRLELEGETSISPATLVFVGVGERRLATPRFGEPVRHGKDALQVVVVDGRTPARQLVRALTAAARGYDASHETPGIESHLVETCVVELPLPSVRVALDGEIHRMRTPLRYRFAPRALRVVTPKPEDRRETD